MKFYILTTVLNLTFLSSVFLVSGIEISSIKVRINQNSRISYQTANKRISMDDFMEKELDQAHEEKINIDDHALKKKIEKIDAKNSKSAEKEEKIIEEKIAETTNKKSREDDKVKLTLSQKWKKLFSVTRDIVECAHPKVEIKEDPVSLDDDDEAETKGVLKVAPYKAKDEYSTRELGFGLSAYFFDFLDATLQKRVLKDFTEMWKAALAIKPTDEKYEDPYALANMLNGKATKLADINAKESAELLKKLKLIYPKFDEITWMKSLDGFKIHAIIEQWKWDYPLGTVDPAKYLITKFDFNGDGRLSVQEFIVASIYTNKKILGGHQCEHCYNKLIQDLIDPIFHFTDCDSDLRVTAEEMYKGLRLLKKDHENSYYKCVHEKSSYRTSAVNDFILKSGHNRKGTITNEEFRVGILLGYWTRHVNKDGIITDDSYSRKKERWVQGKDTKCEEILTAVKATKRAVLADKLRKMSK